MTYIVKPVNHHPNLKKNSLGLTRRDYEPSQLYVLDVGMILSVP